jgi:hypothetical protein
MTFAVRRIGQFRASFVAVVGAFSVEGCSVALDPQIAPTPEGCRDDPWSTSGCIPARPADSCPDSDPGDGPCQDGMYCEYGSCYGTPTSQLYCNGGVWERFETSCNPPPPSVDAGVGDTTCPVSTRPVPGAPCRTDLECAYDYCDSYPTLTFTCAGGIWRRPMQASCNPPPPVEACPEISPTAGQSCFGNNGGAPCTYPLPGPCGEYVVTCVGSVWVNETPSCNPPPPSCPADAPAVGSDCVALGEGLTCGYDSLARCEQVACVNGAWARTPVVDCDPCPVAQPNLGATCSMGGPACEYGPYSARCEAGVWQVMVRDPNSGAPAPTACPAVEPTRGQSCSHVGSSCVYDACVSFDCTNGAWAPGSWLCFP